MRVKGMSNGLVKIFEKKTGEAIEVYPIDAKDLLKSGTYIDHNPNSKNLKTDSRTAKLIITKQSDEEEQLDDLNSMTRSELLEYAESKFGVELNNRYGEVRLRGEIEKLIQQEEYKDEEEKEEKEEIDLTKEE